MNERDPEQLLRDLPEQSPPPEIVLAAVRVFRYRAIAVIALAFGLTVSGIYAAHRFLGPVTTDDEVQAVRHGGQTVTIANEQDVAGVHVLFWEVIWKAGKGFAHFQAWDPQNRNFGVEVRNLSVGGRPVQVVGGGGGGSCCHPDMDEEWVQFADPTFPEAPISADVAVTLRTEGSTTTPHVIGIAHLSYGGQG